MKVPAWLMTLKKQATRWENQAKNAGVTVAQQAEGCPHYWRGYWRGYAAAKRDCARFLLEYFGERVSKLD